MPSHGYRTYNKNNGDILNNSDDNLRKLDGWELEPTPRCLSGVGLLQDLAEMESHEYYQMLEIHWTGGNETRATERRFSIPDLDARGTREYGLRNILEFRLKSHFFFILLLLTQGLIVLPSVWSAPSPSGGVCSGAGGRSIANECEEHLSVLANGSFYDNFLQHADVEHFDALCGVFQKWTFCMRSVAAKCNQSSTGFDVYLDRTKATIARTCSTKRELTITTLSCMTSQSSKMNHLFNGCYDIMQLKRHLKPFDICTTMTEYLQCEDRLMRSACGSALADFRLAVSVESRLDPERLENNQCLYTPDDTYPGFQYSMSCPPEFPTVMRVCYREFNRSPVVLFPNLLAVVRSSEETIDNYCRALDDYRQCLKTIEDTCWDGVELVYAVSPEWNRTIQLATYICDLAFHKYKAHLPCYSDTTRQSSYTDVCRLMFDKYPTKQEMYLAKCHPNDTESLKSLEKRDRLITCYEYPIRKQCGDAASDVISPLIHMHYSFDFHVPCQLPPILSLKDKQNRTLPTPRPTPLGNRFLTTWYPGGFLPGAYNPGAGNHYPSVMGDGAVGGSNGDQNGVIRKPGGDVATGSLKMTIPPEGGNCHCPILAASNGASQPRGFPYLKIGLVSLVIFYIANFISCFDPVVAEFSLLKSKQSTVINNYSTNCIYANCTTNRALEDSKRSLAGVVR